jgi:hypothetical protein
MSRCPTGVTFLAEAGGRSARATGIRTREINKTTDKPISQLRHRYNIRTSFL